MCGICGIVQKQHPVEPALIARMQGAMVHRGPDQSGEFFTSSVGLGMRRLSIIDLTGGWQPFYNKDRSLTLIVNGEIYNYLELQEKLTASGHSFTTKSDCETILHLYEEYGLDCVHHLRGMFAFALWDDRKKRLLLGRDRMGEKPLYLCELPDSVLFASELKALLSSGMVPFELDPDSIDLYFHYNYVPEPATPLKGIRKLPAAHLFVLDLESWQGRDYCYWRMEDAPPLDDDPEERIREELDTVSELIIRADVPVGIALSGGLDSTTIAALTSKKYTGKMHAFSIGYEGRPPCDERAMAEQMAKHLDIPFHELELATSDLVAFFPDLVSWTDDPIADFAAFGYYSVSRLAQEHNVKVLLQGQGGDELFWGYEWVRSAMRESSQKLQVWRQGHVLGIAKFLSQQGPKGISTSHMIEWIKKLVRLPENLRLFHDWYSSNIEQLVFYDLYPGFAKAHQNTQTMYGPAMNQRSPDHTPFGLFTVHQPWPQLDLLMTKLISQTYLLENGMAQGDRLSMASSVELRLPLSDYRLVEVVMGLRKRQRDHDKEPKQWLKGAMRNDLPSWVLKEKKRGFEPPVRNWQKALFEAYGSVLEDGYLAQSGILAPESARHLAKGEFGSGVIIPTSFAALVLEMWCRKLSPIANGSI